MFLDPHHLAGDLLNGVCAAHLHGVGPVSYTHLVQMLDGLAGVLAHIGDDAVAVVEALLLGKLCDDRKDVAQQSAVFLGQRSGRGDVLDVYKRQPSRWLLWCWVPSFPPSLRWCTWHWALWAYRCWQTSPAVSISSSAPPAANRPASVSYTHLDVYKRQTL